MIFDVQSLLDQQEAIAQGIGQTLFISTVSTALALVLGLVVLSMRQGPWGIVRWVCRAYVEFFRNTPLLIHLYLLYKGLPYLGLTIDPVMCGIIGLSLQSAAYMTEIYRAGIEAVPRQQTESGLSIGLSRTEVLFSITLPQALRLILPPLGNQIVGVFKNSSLVAFITVPDIFFVVYEQSVTYFHYLEYFTLGLAVYMVLTLMTTAVVMGAERCVPWLFVQLEWALLTLPPLWQQFKHVLVTSSGVPTRFRMGAALPMLQPAPRYALMLSDEGMTSPLRSDDREPMPAELQVELTDVTQQVDALCSGVSGVLQATNSRAMQSPFAGVPAASEEGFGE